MNFFGTALDDTLEGQETDDFLRGNDGNDFLVGNDGNDRLIGGNDNFALGGRDTLVGGLGNDGYVVSFVAGSGSQIQDTGGTDAVLIFNENTDPDNFNTPESFANASFYGDAAIALSFPQSGIVGLSKSGTNLIVDLNRDGFAEPENDLTIIDFFNEQGQFGIGAVELINNIVDTQDIIDFFNNSQPVTDNAVMNLELNAIAGTTANDVLEGTADNDSINGGEGNDFLSGLEGDDFITGGGGNDFINGGTLGQGFATIGGKDTLEGGGGNDSYGVSLTSGGGTVIKDTGGIDIVSILAENTDTEGLGNGGDVADASLYGDAAITLSQPRSGIVGLSKSETDLIVDLNRDGFADPENDLTIVDFFGEPGQLGTGAVELINNVVDTQEIVDFFTDPQETLDDNLVTDTREKTVYRFFNNNTGVHFYTADTTEKNAVEELENFVFEGPSYNSVDSLTGESVPVYRFLNQDTGVHLYTISENERNTVENLNNFSLEGEAFSAYATEVDGSIPIYRFYNPNTGAHFYTPSATERDSVNNLPDFQSEGIAYYALPEITENENLI